MNYKSKTDPRIIVSVEESKIVDGVDYAIVTWFGMTGDMVWDDFISKFTLIGGEL